MITVLVTGASGYIGSHTCKELQAQGYRVIGVDAVKRPHTEKYMDLFVHADYDSDATTKVLNEDMVDTVIHCAGTSLVGPSMEHPAPYYINNVAKTASFLQTCLWANKVPNFVFSSSAAVYGAPDCELIYENQSYSPISPYGQTKTMIEIMLADYARAYGFTSMSLRYFNACGADASGELGQAPGATHIIARLLESIRDKTQFTLYGTDYNTADGTCIRDYVHVTDIALAHCAAVRYLASGAETCSYINLGSREGFSNQEIINATERLIGKVDLVKGARRVGDPACLVASNNVAQTTLGWVPEHSDLGSIINSAWKWYNNPINVVAS